MSTRWNKIKLGLASCGGRWSHKHSGCQLQEGKLYDGENKVKSSTEILINVLLCFCHLRKHNFWLLKLLETSFQGPFDNGHFDRKFSTSLTNCLSLAVENGCFDGSLRFKSRLKRIEKYLLASCRPEARYSTTTLQLSWLTWGSITLLTRFKQDAFRQFRKRRCDLVVLQHQGLQLSVFQSPHLPEKKNNIYRWSVFVMRINVSWYWRVFFISAAVWNCTEKL